MKIYERQILRQYDLYKNDRTKEEQFEYMFTYNVDKALTSEQFNTINKLLINDGFILRSLQEQNKEQPKHLTDEPQIVRRSPDGEQCIKSVWTHEQKTLSIVYDYEGSNEDGLTIYCTLNKKDYAKELLIGYVNKLDLKPLTESIGKIFLIVNEYQALRLRGFELTIPNTKLDMAYNDGVLKNHLQVVEKLKNDKPGIHLFHGEPGTGKTTYIRHLTKLVNKRFLFLPPNFGEYLANPGFIPFLMSNATNSVLVMEDAEMVIKERELKENHEAISNVLNMTDGLIGDIVKPQIIFTFNCNLDKIDKAILRKGRCHSRIEFPKLEIEKANNLAKELKLNRSFSAPTTLAEVVSDELATV